MLTYLMEMKVVIMALDYGRKVEIPQHTVRVPNGDKVYIQYVVRAYRNDKGQPTNERVSIGKLDPETGLMIPNKRYYEIFGGQESSELPSLIRASGSYGAFHGIAKELGLEKIVRKHFGEKTETILSVAHYMLLEGNVMYYLDDWQDEHITYSRNPLHGNKMGDIFCGITETERICFFNDWMKRKGKEEYLAYDVTSISSYGQGMENLEWGYNRDKEKLPQINLGMYYGEESRLPLYYRIYPGSIPDKSHLKYMVEDNDVICCKKARFVMDRGFYSQENLSFLVQKGCRFIIALPGHIKTFQEMIDKHREELINRSECYLGSGRPYGKAYIKEMDGFRMKIHLYYDPYKAVTEHDSVLREVEKMEAELKEMETPPEKKLHYDRYFYINRSKEGKLGFRRNAEAINKALSRCGFFLIGETDFKKTTTEILDIYRRRDVVEKSFDNLKNDLDMRRLHVHSDEAAEGKAFISFLALIVRSQMQNKLQEYMNTHKFTFRKILLELDKVKMICAPGKGDACRLLNPPTKLQREIMEVLDLSADDLHSIS